MGLLWLGLTLAFEWGGSVLIQRRPVHDILVGWHAENGYMWPYVLLAYFAANLIIGLALHLTRTDAPRSAQPAVTISGRM